MAMIPRYKQQTSEFIPFGLIAQQLIEIIRTFYVKPWDGFQYNLFHKKLCLHNKDNTTQSDPIWINFNILQAFELVPFNNNTRTAALIADYLPN